MGKIIGIDLGTTNSVVAVMEGGEPVVITNSEGGRTTPSVVAFAKDGNRLVGQVAKRQAVTNPENTIYSIKRFMGRRFNEVSEEIKQVPYKVQGTGTGGDVRIVAGGKEWSPPEISAMILQKMKQSAEDYLGQKVEKAVITVPAYFNDSQRQATKDAGKIAGLEVMRIVNEPTAASLAYGLQKRKQGIIAVYDLGGGTFDISILKLKSGIFEVLATNGNTHLGGDDFDRRLVDVMMQDLKAKHGLSVEGRPALQQDLRVRAEQAKCRLSAEAQATVHVPLPDSKGEYRRTFSRAELENLVNDLIEKTLAPCRQAIKDA